MGGEGTISKYQKDKMKKTQHIGAALKGGRVNLRLLKNRERRETRDKDDEQK